MARTLVEKFRPILGRYAPYMNELKQGEVYDVDFWTPLKLYVIASYIHTCYVKIIPNTFIDGNFYYIDLLANCGLNMVGDEKTKKEKHPFPGSPLLAATANPPFKRMYFVDIDGNKLTSLSKRLEILKAKGLCKSDYRAIVGDCNGVIDGILGEIKQSPYHLLTFADNSGLDVTWNTVCKLLECYCDLIINYPTSNMKRAFGQARAGYELNKLHDFFGCNVENEVSIESELLEYYANMIRIKGKNVEKIHIDTDIGYGYDLLIVTKLNAGFTSYINSLKKSIEGVSADDVEAAFQVLSGKQSTLANHI